MKSLGLKVEKQVLGCDNESALYIIKKSFYHKRTKCIEIWLNFICDIVEEEKFSILKINTLVQWTC